jgi:hypothetical protein
MNDSDDNVRPEDTSARSTLTFGATIGVFQVGQIKITQRYACIRRDQFEWTTSVPFPSAFRDYLATRGPLRGTSVLYVLDIPHAFQLTIAPNAGRAVFVPRLATELDWQKKVVIEIVSTLDEILRSV